MVVPQHTICTSLTQVQATVISLSLRPPNFEHDSWVLNARKIFVFEKLDFAKTFLNTYVYVH